MSLTEDPPHAADLTRLVTTLAAAPHELEWLEFKENYEDPDSIGRYISALSNAAALHGESRAFLVWGVADGTHDVVGTRFEPATKKKGGEPLGSWLSHMLTPRIDFTFYQGLVGEKRVVVLEIPAAMHTPTRFHGEEYIRVGSTTKKLRDFPDKARKLWFRLTRVTFEDGIAKQGLTVAEVLSHLDVPAYFELSGQPVPTTPERIVERLMEDRLVTRAPDGTFEITNLGAIAFGSPLQRLRLDRKGLRVVVYDGASRTHATHEVQFRRGYIAGFKEMMGYIVSQVPRSEVIGRALRQDVPVYPEEAVRELVANALMHQDFAITGTGPIVEIFAGRIEITNPGRPLVDPMRLLDSPSRARNEQLATAMRRFRYAEERGSGIDRVVTLAEAYQLPAPEFTALDEHFVATLHAPRPLNRMTKEDRIRACYQHACLQWVARSQLTNASLRSRFGISEGNSSIASRIIAETETGGLIKKHNPESWSRKHARYVPFWA